MQDSTLSLRGAPSTCTAVGVLGSGTVLGNDGSFECLEAFIEASHARGIVSGVQVKLLLELAQELASVRCGADTPSQGYPADKQAPCTADVASSPDSKAEQARSEPRQHTPPAVRAPAACVYDCSNSKLTATAAPSASAGHAKGCGLLQPQLHIQPLNLNSHLGSLNAGATDAAAVSGSLDTALQLQQALASSSTPFSNQASGLLGLSPALLAAVAAQAAAQQQQQQQVQVAQVSAACESPKSPTQQHTAPEVCIAGPATADVSISAPVSVAAPTLVAGWGGCSNAVKAAASRNHRFTKDQQAAILESVERNYAQYPSRYTELVIKEMQTLFPGIEINNACVRKIKFRANEAIKQVSTSVSAAPGGAVAAAETTSWMSCTPFERAESQAAAEAAHGLVGLAAAAAAVGGDADEQQQQQRRPVVSGAFSAGEYNQAHNKPCDSVMTDKVTLADDGTKSGPCAAAAAAPKPQLQLAPQPQQQQQQGSESAIAIKGEQKQQQQQQQQVPDQQQHQQASADLSSASAAGPFAASDDGAVDSATAAAVEAMHMLARCSSLSGPAVTGTTDTRLLSATTAPPASASLKRKLEERDGPTDSAAEATAAASAIGLANASAAPDSSAEAAEQPTAMQIAEALAAAAGLVECSSALPAAAAVAAALPQQVEGKVESQRLQWPSAGVAGAGAAGAGGVAQSSLERHLLQLQQLYKLQQQQHDNNRLQSSTPAAPGAAVPPNPSAATVSSTVPAAAAAATTSAANTATAATARAATPVPAAKRQRLNGVQMAELVASVRHHVQVNPERYTHCVIKDMKEKYPELDINMGQIRKIKFRTLGNCNPRQASKPQPQQSSSCDPSASATAAMQRPPTPSTRPDAASAYSVPSLTAAAPAAGAVATAAVTSSSVAAPPPGFSWDASKALEAVAAAAAAASMGFNAAPAAVARPSLQQIQ